MNRFVLLAALAFSAPLQAVEGMWQPQQLPAIERQLRSAGIAVDPKELADLTRYPMNAVISLGGFCTASFVSPMGLIVTNHHCAFGSIQFNSTAERNLIDQGFLAQTLGDELKGEPTLRVYVTESITEVSAKVRGKLVDEASDRARFDAIAAVSKELVAECETDAAYRCEVQVFNGGVEYFLIKQLQIRDVRLVYAPAEAIGNFGGDVDNFTWPRHTGDFAYYRAYVGPDGKPADYSESNVPYRPKSHLKIQVAGLKPGDFAMVVGYPGHSSRYRLAEEVSDAISWQYPSLLERYRQRLALIALHTKDRPDAAIKYASAVASLSNGLKNLEGNLDGFAGIDVVRSKADEEALILKWAAANAESAGVAGYAALKVQLADLRTRRDRDQILQLIGANALYAAARDLYRLAVEREKPDAERELEFQERDEPRIQSRLLQLDRRFDPEVDRAILSYLLEIYIALPADQHVAELDRWLAAGAAAPSVANISERLDALYAGTRLGDTTQRMKWFKAGHKAIETADDPALELAVAMLPVVLRLEAQKKSYLGQETRNRPAWMATRMAYAKAHGQEVYADANNSLRVSFGKVQGYSPREGVAYGAFTDLNGIVEKHTGSAPFDATERQLEAIRSKKYGPYAVDGSVPVNLMADLDITGGNSGSPILNARAELVGLAFDYNYEAAASAWLFNPDLTRSLGVDVRYMLWIMDAIDGAHGLLEEMGVKPAFAGDDRH